MRVQGVISFEYDRCIILYGKNTVLLINRATCGVLAPLCKISFEYHLSIVVDYQGCAYSCLYRSSIGIFSLNAIIFKKNLL